MSYEFIFKSNIYIFHSFFSFIEIVKLELYIGSNIRNKHLPIQTQQ